MKTFALLFALPLLGASCLLGAELTEPTNAPPAKAEKNVEAPKKEDNPVQKELDARDDRRADREAKKADRDTKGIETFAEVRRVESYADVITIFRKRDFERDRRPAENSLLLFHGNL